LRLIYMNFNGLSSSRNRVARVKLKSTLQFISI